MMARRWIALLAAILLVSVGGGSRPPATDVSLVASADMAGVMSASPDWPAPLVGAADISRPPIMSRPESQAARLLATALFGALLLAAASTRRKPFLRRRLDLLPRADSHWRLPSSGRRAPPPGLTR